MFISCKQQMQTFLADVHFTEHSISSQALQNLLKQTIASKQQLFLTGGDNLIHIWNEKLEIIKTTEIVSSEKKHDSGTVYSCTQLHDGRIAIGFERGLILILNRYTLHVELTLNPSTFSVWTMVQLKNGLLATAGDDCKILLWDVTTGKRKYEHTEKNNIRKLFELRDGRLVLGGFDRDILFFDVTNGLRKTPAMLSGHTDNPRDIIQTDDNTLVSGGDDRRIFFWDLEKLTAIKKIEIPTTCWSLVLLPEGNISVAGNSGEVVVIDTSKEELSLKVAVSETKHIVATCLINQYIVTGRNEAVIIYNLRNGKTVYDNALYGAYARAIMNLKQ